MKQTPIVSIIMAVYNCEKTLKKSIDSILNQTYLQWKFIICDDGSTDNTYNILKEYKNKYPEKFIIISNETNSKLPYSLNHCLKYVDTEYVARMDGDDWSSPTRLEKQIDFLQSHPEYDLVGTGVSVFNGKETIASITKIEIPQAKDITKENSFSHATIMCHKYVYDKLNGYSLDKYALRVEDVDLWIRFFEAGFRGYNLSENLYTILEDENAVKRRTLSARINDAVIRFKGYKKIGICGISRYVTFIYILKAFVPIKLNKYIHHYRLKKQSVTK